MFVNGLASGFGSTLSLCLALMLEKYIDHERRDRTKNNTMVSYSH